MSEIVVVEVPVATDRVEIGGLLDTIVEVSVATATVEVSLNTGPPGPQGPAGSTGLDGLSFSDTDNSPSTRKLFFGTAAPVGQATGDFWFSP